MKLFQICLLRVKTHLMNENSLVTLKDAYFSLYATFDTWFQEWKIPSDQVQLERRQISPYVSSNLPSMHSDAVSQATHASLGSMTEDGLLVLRVSVSGF